MIGIMNENQLTVESKLDNPLIQKTVSIIDYCIRDCHNQYFHTFDHICEFGIKLRNITNNGTVNFTIFDKSMGLYGLNKTLTVARQKGSILNQINKLTKRNYSNLSHINIH